MTKKTTRYNQVKMFFLNGQFAREGHRFINSYNAIISYERANNLQQMPSLQRLNVGQPYYRKNCV